jgi:hypothetical protein
MRVDGCLERSLWQLGGREERKVESKKRRKKLARSRALTVVSCNDSMAIDFPLKCCTTMS